MNEWLIISLLIALVVYVYFYLRRVETYDDPVTREIHQKLMKLDPRAQKLSIRGSSQSFTEDKERMYLCLKNEKGEYYDQNFLMYVAIHELAHVISQQVDPNHTTDEFKNNFKMLLAKAADMKLYDPSQPLIYDYCPKNNKAIEMANSGPAAPSPGVIVEYR
jgi:hypothetical protein